MDDGSVDGTAEIVHGFSDSTNPLHPASKCGPRRWLRNRGVAEATSQYVSFLDSDDLWAPDKLSSSVTFLSNHPEAGGIFHDLEWSCGDEVKPSFMRAYSTRMLAWLAGRSYPEGTLMPDRELYLMLLQGIIIKPTALTVDSLAFKTSGGFKSAKGVEDWDFALRFAKQNRLAYLDRPLGMLRVTPESEHSKEINQTRNFKIVCDLLSKERSLISSHDTEALAAISAGIIDTTNSMCWRYLGRGKRLAAINTYLIGFAKTGNVELLLRALGACLPISLFQAAKALMGQRAEG